MGYSAISPLYLVRNILIVVFNRYTYIIILIIIFYFIYVVCIPNSIKVTYFKVYILNVVKIYSYHYYCHVKIALWFNYAFCYTMLKRREALCSHKQTNLNGISSAAIPYSYCQSEFIKDYAKCSKYIEDHRQARFYWNTGSLIWEP